MSRRASSSRRQSLLKLGTDQIKTHDDAAACVKRVCEQQEGSVLKAWLKHFDPENNQSIATHEFSKGLRMMGYHAGQELMKILDEDGSGELSLVEIDPVAAKLWHDFRLWCAARFENVADMLKTLGGKQAVGAEEIPRQAFIEGLARFGWVNEQPGDDELLFKALDKDSSGALQEKQLDFLAIEKRRTLRKQQARHSATKEPRNKADDPIHLARARTKFKRFLKRKFNNYIRAWRSVLSPGGAMSLQRNTFLKACASCGYNDNLKLLWKAFDKDDSGSITIDELDLQSAEVLADFKNFVKKKFGKSANAFRAIDMDGSRRVQFQEFANALQYYDFHRPPKILFEGLDRYDRKTIVEEDMKFLDDWKPLPFLTAQVNQPSATALKDMLQAAYKTYLLGWRHCLDADGDNHCNYQEFEVGCKKLGFDGDVAGAWRALDIDLNGYITLLHIDPVTSKALYDFRLWAEAAFGSIRSAFNVFDDDGSKEITFREFVKCCHIYGFEGNSHQLFHALDINRDKSLTYRELTFLEHWEFPTEAKDEARRRSTMRASIDGVPVDSTSGKLEKPRRQTVAQKLGRQKTLPEIEEEFTARKNLAELREGANPKQEEKVEPMVLVAMDWAPHVYANPPYRLARKFRTRPITTSSLSPISHAAGMVVDEQGRPLNMLQGGMYAGLGSAQLSSCEGSGEDEPVRSPCGPRPAGGIWHNSWDIGRQPASAMPTLDDLLLPVAGRQECGPPQPHWRRNRGRRLHLARGRKTNIALKVVPLPSDGNQGLGGLSVAMDVPDVQLCP